MRDKSFVPATAKLWQGKAARRIRSVIRTASGQSERGGPRSARPILKDAKRAAYSAGLIKNLSSSDLDVLAFRDRIRAGRVARHQGWKTLARTRPHAWPGRGAGALRPGEIVARKPDGQAS